MQLFNRMYTVHTRERIIILYNSTLTPSSFVYLSGTPHQIDAEKRRPYSFDRASQFIYCDQIVVELPRIRAPHKHKHISHTYITSILQKPIQNVLHEIN